MPSYDGAFTDEQIWDLIHYVQTLPEPGAEERAKLARKSIPASRVSGPITLDPSADQWSKIKGIVIPMTPLWWRDDRVESVEVKALHNGEQLAIHLSWLDAANDNSTVAPQSFSDGAAIQLSAESDPPFFAMGSAGSAVTLWHWKASWEEDAGAWRDIEDVYPNTGTDWYPSQTNYEHGAPFETAKSGTLFHDPALLTGRGAGNPLSDPERAQVAEEARAEGFGTLTTVRPQLDRVEAKGVWQSGRRQVVFLRSLAAEDDARVSFTPGAPVSVAFAIWDGIKGDRNGQKMISTWNELILEQ